MNVKLTFNGKEFYATANQAKTIQTLLDTQKGGFANIEGYVSTSGRESPEVANLTILSRFDTSKLYTRKIAALQSISFNDMLRELLESGDTKNLEKLKALSLNELQSAFSDRVQKLVDSMSKTLTGDDRSDAHRVAHDTFYCVVGQGIKVHFVTTDTKAKELVLKDGLPVVDSIMLNAITISKKVIVEGKYKTVNSGVPVLISNILERMLPKSTKLRTVSLKEGKFAAITISKETILNEAIN